MADKLRFSSEEIDRSMAVGAVIAARARLTKARERFAAARDGYEDAVHVARRYGLNEEDILMAAGSLGAQSSGEQQHRVAALLRATGVQVEITVSFENEHHSDISSDEDAGEVLARTGWSCRVFGRPLPRWSGLEHEWKNLSVVRGADHYDAIKTTWKANITRASVAA